MNVVLWLVAGGAIGLLAFVWLNLNANRGVQASVGIGMLAAFFGGHVLAPAFGAGDVRVFSAIALLVAAATAFLCLSIIHIASKRFA